MNLIIDVGNTRVKAGVFEGEILKKTYTFPTLSTLIAEVHTHTFEQVMIGTVVDLDEQVLKLLQKLGTCMFFTAETPTPLRNMYRSVSTLGSDRLAAACGGYLHFRGSSFLVIDAGTCLKYNYTDKLGNYLGGGISPGLNMRFKAMHEHTNRLPLITFDEQYNSLIGNNTHNSIKMGAQIGMLAEVEGIIERYSQFDTAVKIVLTGGDAAYLQKELKSNIFVDPHLILKGLNSILNYHL
jgi:type III pantothenate kinase